MYVYIHVYKHICMYIHVYIGLRVPTGPRRILLWTFRVQTLRRLLLPGHAAKRQRSRLNVMLCVRECVRECVCVHTHACMHTHTHTHTQMHAYKQVQYVSDHLPRGLRDHVYVYVCVYI